jgi:hypothetical protein
MFGGDKGEIVQIFLDERTNNKQLIGIENEEQIWYKIVTGEGFFSLIFAESWRLFAYPFDEAAYGYIIEDMKVYGSLIDYRVQYLKYALPFLPVLFLVALFDGFMMREVAKKTYSFSSPFTHNFAINYLLFPSVFMSLVFLFLPFPLNILYVTALYLIATLGIWVGVAHYPKRF